jgi:uncharacterized Zn-binding protein involved in type VI secretion
MRRSIVRHGDPTTTRGFVIALSSTMFDDGKNIALSGDSATCGNCKGTHRIFGTGEGVSEGGRVVVVHGDRVLCPCGKNRVMAFDSGCHLNSAAEGSRSPSSDTGHAVKSQPRNPLFDEQIVLLDANGNALADTYYSIRMPDGKLRHGTTDSQGRTARHQTSGAQDVAVFLGHRTEV